MSAQRPPRKRPINIRLPGDLIDQLDRAAEAADTTRTALIEAGAHRELRSLETRAAATAVIDAIPTPAEVNAQPLLAHKRRAGLTQADTAPTQHLPTCRCTICKPPRPRKDAA